MGNYLQKNPYPATSGGTPSTPGSPYVAGYYTYVASPVQNSGTAPFGWAYQNVTVYDPVTGKNITQVQLVPTTSVNGVIAPGAAAVGTYPSTQTLQQVAVWNPPQLAVAPTAGTPPSYPPSQWDAGAESIAFLAADGDFTCTVDNGVGGICVGFATALSLDPKNIDFGLYFHDGGVQAFENVPGLPTATGALTTYTAADVWILRRRLGVGSVLKNGTTVYTATNRVAGPKVVQASLFSPYDTMRAAALTAYASGSVTGGFQNLRGRAGLILKYVDGRFQPLQASISANGHGSVAGRFQYLAGNAGIRQSYARGSFRNFAATISNGGFIPAPPNLVAGQFLIPQGVIHGLTGGKGQVAGSFLNLDAMTGKARQGKATGSFLKLAGQILAHPPGVLFMDSYAAVVDSIDISTLLVVNIDSTGTATDAYLVQVTATGTNMDSAALASTQWVVSQVDSVNLDSAAVAHDLMGLGAALGPLAVGPAVWVLNVDTGASARYENFNYTSLATHAGRLFGTKADGVYLLEGNDDAGTQITASFASGQLDFASDKDPSMAGALKRVVAAYLGVASDKSMLLKVVSNGQEFLYVARTSSSTLMQQRVDPGRGLRGNYYSFEVFNQQGSNFDIDSIEFVPIKLPRRVS